MDKLLLTPLCHSVQACQGKFKNLFLDEDLVEFYQPKGNVVCIESNYGIQIAKKYNYVKKTNKREREKRAKRAYKRKKQCNGTQFNSQIQFHVRSHFDKSKVYKIKCFRKETFSIPGILKYDKSDMLPSLNELCEYHKESNLDDTIRIESVYPILINFKCRLINENLSIELKEIIYQLSLYKKNSLERDHIRNILIASKISDKMLKAICFYIPVNRLNISELKYEPERFPSGITVKFARPSVRINKPKDLKAKSTIKIFRSGKINFDAVKSRCQAEDMYYWLNHFITKYYDHVIYDNTLSSSSSSDYDSSSNSDSDSSC